MRPDVTPNTRQCPECGYFSSDLPVVINENTAAIDEKQRLEALSTIRHKNFAKILNDLAATKEFSTVASALDVGCGHGWFLDGLKAKGHRGMGVEPDVFIAKIAKARGHEVATGFFPSAIPADARFDAIFFHDVFEHMPDINQVVENVRRHTTDEGWVIVNLPVSDGIIFQISRMLARLGLRGPYNRLWQVGLPSPHLSYFASGNIETLFLKHGFALAQSKRLRTLSFNGLFARIRYDRSINPLLASVYYVAALVLVPALTVLPADIRYFVFRKEFR